jgi:predicted RNase H-like HicB family nuclease
LTQKENIMTQFKVIIEKHPDGYIAYPLGMKGSVVAQGDSYEEAMHNVKSALNFHIETFGSDALEPLLSFFAPSRSLPTLPSVVEEGDR